METKIYMVKVDENKGSDDYTDKEFVKLAEEQGTIFGLKGFQDWYNYEPQDYENYYIRILND